MNPDCIFCSIIQGKIPATRVYEDGQVLAFLDIRPITKGHTLVIPKIHVDPITATPDDVLHPLISAVRLVAQALTKALGADGINVTQANGPSAGQVVPHLHFHVIPRWSRDGHATNWNPTPYADNDEMAEFGRRIREALAAIREAGPHA